MFKSFFDVYGTSIRLQTPLEKFHRFVGENYSQFQTGTLNEVEIDVRYGEQAGEKAAENQAELTSYGKGIAADENQLYWENEFGFRLYLSRDRDGNVEIDAFHRDLLGKSDLEERYKDYQRSMRWALHFPLFTRFRYQRGWRLVHASAVTKDGNAIALCGLNGVGKSTLAMYLCQEYGYKLMTDNFLLLGPDRLYGFPEVVRLSPEANERLGLPTLWDTHVYGKHHVSPSTVGVELEATPKAFFIIGRDNRLMSRKISSDTGWETVKRLHSYLGEFPAHSYMSIWPYISSEKTDTTRVERSARSTPWYELQYELDWNLDAVAQEVTECI